MTSDKLFTLSNVYAGTDKTLFSVVRYGNVMGSRGSIVPKILELKNLGKEIPLTDDRMTRFWITMNQAIKFVIESIEEMQGGEIFIPKIPSVKIVDLIKAIAPASKIIKTGIRPGEKIHEEMIASDDSRLGLEQENKYVIYQSIESYMRNFGMGKELSEFFTYRSDTNKDWLNLSQINGLISIN